MAAMNLNPAQYRHLLMAVDHLIGSPGHPANQAIIGQVNAMLKGSSAPPPPATMGYPAAGMSGQGQAPGMGYPAAGAHQQGLGSLLHGQPSAMPPGAPRYDMMGRGTQEWETPTTLAPGQTKSGEEPYLPGRPGLQDPRLLPPDFPWGYKGPT